MRNWVDDLQQHGRPEAWIGLAVAVLVLTLMAGILYGLIPLYAEHLSLAELKSQADAQQSGGDPTASELIRSLEQRLEEQRRQLFGEASTVPREQIESFVIETLDRISRRHRVRLAAVTPGEEGRVLIFEELPYDVEVSGRYFDLHRWLFDVEAELRPMVVREFQVEPEGTGRMLRMRLRLVAYRAETQGEEA